MSDQHPANTDAMVPSPLDWKIPVVKAADGDFKDQWQATSDELERLVATLPVNGIRNLVVTFQLSSILGGKRDMRLEGTVRADIEQTCSVTLDPTSTTLAEAMTVRLSPFVPDVRSEAIEEDELSILDIEDIEAFEDECVPLGRIVYETLPAAIDPFPRKTTESGTWAAGWAADGSKDTPFAALAAIKAPKPGNS